MLFHKIISQKFQERHFEESLVFISVGVFSAVVCSFYARLFALVEHYSMTLFSSNPLLIFLLSPLCILLSYYLVKRFAPGASGSGIPQVLTCIEDQSENLARIFLRKSIVVIKIASSLIAVFAGAAIGREGPSLQIAAAIAKRIGRFSERFGIKIKQNQLLIAGAASGLAAAFNTPIGGIVYAIEELSKEHVRNFRDILLLSVVISGLTAQLINGSYLYLGSPKVEMPTSSLSFLLIAGVGLTCGLLGALFSKTLTMLIKWRASQSFMIQMMILIVIGFLIASSFYFYGDRTLYSGKESINFVLFSKGSIPWYEVISRSLMPLISSMTGIAGGIFAPSLSAGATIGGSLSEILDPAMRTVLGLAGMVGFLTGVTHTPITSLILVLEMTDRHSAVFSMMIAAIFSSIGAHFISDLSFYEQSVLEIKARYKNEN